MKKILSIIAVLSLLPSIAAAQVFKANQLITPVSNGVIVSDGVGTHNLIASSSPMFANITATSTTLQSVLPLFLFTSATGTSATTTNFATTNLCLGTDCRSVWPTSSMTFSWPWTKQADGSQATSTVMGFFNGFNSTASSTVSGVFHLPSLSNGGLSVWGGQVISAATTTAGTGLTYSGNAFNVNTSQNISTLSNLTNNGFVKTSGGTGALSVDTTVYLSAIGSGSNGQLAYWGGSNNLQGVGTSTLTASSPLTGSFTQVGSGGSLGCQTASGSQAGCLSSSDWTTFNNKLGSMTFAWPFTKQASNSQATSTVMEFVGGFLSDASSTLQSVHVMGGNIDGTAIGATTASTGVFSNGTSTNWTITANNLGFGSTGSLYVTATSTWPLPSIASSTVRNGNSFNRASTTITYAPFSENRQIVGASCVATSTAANPGGVNFQVGGKTKWTTALFCDANPRTYTFTAIQVSAFTDMPTVNINAASSTPDSVSINLFTQKVSN